MNAEYKGYTCGQATVYTVPYTGSLCKGALHVRRPRYINNEYLPVLTLSHYVLFMYNNVHIAFILMKICVYDLVLCEVELKK